MSSTFHKIILAKLLQDKDYFRSVFPYLKKEYFEELSTSTIFDIIDRFAAEYKKPPGKEVLLVELEALKGVNETDFKEANSLLEEITSSEYDLDPEWVLNETEKYCKEKALYNAIMDAVSIWDGTDKNRDKGIIPSLMSNALNVCFDKSVGHDYFEEAEERWEFYNSKNAKYPCLVSMIDKITNGGTERKTLNLVMGFLNSGKSAALCSLAASYISQGLNVLYVTLEMSEYKIANRIDANLMNIPMNDIKEVPKTIFCAKVNKIKAKSFGRLMIKEYPGGVMTANGIGNLLDELKIKQDFDADVIIVDYLGICASAHFKPGSAANSYTVQKSISEELRGLAVERDKILWSAVQGNRSSANSSDMNATNIADSIGVLMTADLCIGIIRLPDLDELGHVMFKQIKNRYGDASYFERFVVGFDRARMKLYDLEDQNGIINSNQRSPDEEDMDMIADEVKKESKKIAEKTANSSTWTYE